MTPDGACSMGKTQKNAFLDDRVCELVNCLQRAGGPSFPRLVTAAILKYAFDAWQPPPSADGVRSEAIWMGFAVDIEHGRFTVDEIPLALLERGYEITGEWVRYYSRDNQTDEEKQEQHKWLSTRGKISKTLLRWKNLCKDSKNEWDAIVKVIEGGGFHPPATWVRRGKLDGPDYEAVQ